MLISLRNILVFLYFTCVICSDEVSNDRITKIAYDSHFWWFFAVEQNAPDEKKEVENLFLEDGAWYQPGFDFNKILDSNTPHPWQSKESPFGWANDGTYNLPWTPRTQIAKGDVNEDTDCSTGGCSVVLKKVYFQTIFTMSAQELATVTTPILKVVGGKNIFFSKRKFKLYQKNQVDAITIILNKVTIGTYEANSMPDPFENEWNKEILLYNTELIEGNNTLACIVTSNQGSASNILFALDLSISNEPSGFPNIPALVTTNLIAMAIILAFFILFFRAVNINTADRYESIGVKLLERDIIHHGNDALTAGKRIQKANLIFFQVWEFLMLLSFCFVPGIPWSSEEFSGGLSVISMNLNTFNLNFFFSQTLVVRGCCFAPILILNALKYTVWKPGSPGEKYGFLVDKMNKIALDILLIPVVRLLIYINSCHYYGNNDQFFSHLIMDRGIQCWEELKSVITVVRYFFKYIFFEKFFAVKLGNKRTHFGLVLLDLLIFSCITGLAMNYKVSKDLQSDAMAFEPRFNIALVSVKILLCIITALFFQASDSLKSGPITSIVIVGAAAVGLLILNVSYLPCVSPAFHKVNYWKSASFAGVSWAAVVAMIVIAMNDPGSPVPFILLFLGLILIMPVAWFLTKRWSERSLIIDPSKPLKDSLDEVNEFVGETMEVESGEKGEKYVTKGLKILNLLEHMLKVNKQSAAKRILKTELCPYIVQFSSCPNTLVAESSSDCVISLYNNSSEKYKERCVEQFGSTLIKILAENLQPKDAYIQATANASAEPELRKLINDTDILPHLLEINYSNELNISSTIELMKFTETNEGEKARALVDSKLNDVIAGLTSLLGSDNPILLSEATKFLLKLRVKDLAKIKDCFALALSSDKPKTVLAALTSVRKFYLVDKSIIDAQIVRVAERQMYNKWEKGFNSPIDEDIFKSSLITLQYADTNDESYFKKLLDMFVECNGNAKREDTQWRILRGIECMNKTNERFEKEILDKLQGKDIEWKVGMLDVVETIGTTSPAIKKAVIEQLYSNTAWVVENAIDTLPTLNCFNEFPSSKLVPYFYNSNPQIRERTADAYCRFDAVEIVVLWSDLFKHAQHQTDIPSQVFKAYKLLVIKAREFILSQETNCSGKDLLKKVIRTVGIKMDQLTDMCNFAKQQNLADKPSLGKRASMWALQSNFDEEIQSSRLDTIFKPNERDTTRGAAFANDLITLLTDPDAKHEEDKQEFVEDTGEVDWTGRWILSLKNHLYSESPQIRSLAVELLATLAHPTDEEVLYSILEALEDTAASVVLDTFNALTLLWNIPNGCFKQLMSSDLELYPRLELFLNSDSKRYRIAAFQFFREVARTNEELARRVNMYLGKIGRAGEFDAIDIDGMILQIGI